MRKRRQRKVSQHQLSSYDCEKCEARIYLCELCLKTFDTGSELRQHKKIHSNSKPAETPHRGMDNSLHLSEFTSILECLESFKLLRAMLQNGLKFRLLTLLGNKTMLKQGQNTEVDSLDKENVSFMGNQKDKVARGNRKTGFTCDKCGKWFASRVTLKIHLNSHLGFKPYKCSKCGLRLSQKGGLTVHMRIHTGEKPFTCKVCFRSFTQPVSRDHMAAHMGEKPYKCDLCPSVFASVTVLKTHKISKHTLLRPFQCDICKKDFADVHYMRKHRAVHRKIKPYPCTKCDKSFITKSNLKRHLITHTGERPYVCTICKKSYTNSGALIYHVTTHSEEKNYICGICGQELSTKQNLQAHVKRHAKSV